MVNLNEVVKKTEKDLIEQALLVNKYNITHTARYLMINRTTLIMKIKSLGIQVLKSVNGRPKVKTENFTVESE